MPTIPIAEAIERVASAVESAPPDMLTVIFGELFPERALPTPPPAAGELAGHIRTKIYPEDVVDLWRVLHPSARNTYYDEETAELSYVNARSPRAGRLTRG